ncbi:MAG: PTS sugar transporter subunit IIA [Burkholderiaceae bacterium]
MIGILLITHAPIGQAFIDASSHVYGSVPPKLLAVDVKADEPMDGVNARACALIPQLDDGDGVLVFSDLYGASPCNCASSLSQPGRVEVVSGVSLPLLVRALNYRNLPLYALTERLVSGAAQGVVRISSTAPQNQSYKPSADGTRRFAEQQQQQ